MDRLNKVTNISLGSPPDSNKQLTPFKPNKLSFTANNYEELYSVVADTFSSPHTIKPQPINKTQIIPYSNEGIQKGIKAIQDLSVDRTSLPKGVVWILMLTSALIGIGLGIAFSSGRSSADDRKLKDILAKSKTLN